MTPAELEQQSRDAVIAYLQDSSVKLELSLEGNYWSDKTSKSGYFDLDVFYYRIAQPKPWFRVALTHNEEIITAYSLWNNEAQVESMTVFKKWLTDRVEYDN